MKRHNRGREGLNYRALWPCPCGAQIEVHGRPIACIVVYGHGNNESSEGLSFFEAYKKIKLG